MTQFAFAILDLRRFIHLAVMTGGIGPFIYMDPHNYKARSTGTSSRLS